MTTPDKITAAEERLRRARAKLARLKRANAGSARRAAESRKFIIGAAILAWTDTGEMPSAFAAELRAFMGRWIAANPNDPRLRALDGTEWEVPHGE